ncbi:MAG: response regulator [Pseudanabaenaceae cyanobacterium SKYGB_i_bin29]|nr:response regulator [Pseudanabaenaceae cyanobacterium SKYGB_i_bin29]
MNRLILIIEDSIDNQILLKQVLEDDYQLVCINNGKDALAWLQKHRADLILLDLALPEVDGWEIARQIRQSGNKTPIIAITAHAMKGDRESALAAGCNDYIPKPIDIANVEQQVKYWLQSKEE